MTAIQTFALIGLIIGAAFLYWAGYRGGLIDGRIEGAEEGKNIECVDKAKTISELKASLEFLRGDHRDLAQLCKKPKDSQTFGTEEHRTLLEIASKLQLAAETFSAMSSKTQAQQTLDLRDKALIFAALLKPVAQERAA